MMISIRKFFQVLWSGIALWSCGISVSYCSTVTFTAEFSKLTMVGFYNADHTFNNQLKINGTSIDVCGNDPSCASAMANPSSISVNLTGSSVDFGYDNDSRQNAFSFASNTVDFRGTGIGNEKMIGWFSFTNGAFYPEAALNFTLTSHSSDPVYDNYSFTGVIRFLTNSTGAHANSTDLQKYAEADMFLLTDAQWAPVGYTSAALVYDYNVCGSNTTAPNCNSGSAFVLGYFGSLHLDGLTNPTGGTFLKSSNDELIFPTSSVPVPATLWLFSSGLAVIFLPRRRILAGQARRMR